MGLLGNIYFKSRKKDSKILYGLGTILQVLISESQTPAKISENDKGGADGEKFLTFHPHTEIFVIIPSWKCSRFVDEKNVEPYKG